MRMGENKRTKESRGDNFERDGVVGEVGSESDTVEDALDSLELRIDLVGIDADAQGIEALLLDEVDGVTDGEDIVENVQRTDAAGG